MSPTLFKPSKATSDDQRNDKVHQIIDESMGKWTDEEWDKMAKVYKDLHRNPDLSGNEGRTAGVVHDFLDGIKRQFPPDVFRIEENIGWPTEKGKEFGPRVVALFRNVKASKEKEPIILLRADMDALPVKETTGLDYESKVKDVMHACGHDLHTTALMTAVKALVQAKDKWTGTLIACFQPGEEKGNGAQGMIDGGLYGDKYGIPTPDYIFGGHVTPEKLEQSSLTRGVAYSRSDSWEITMNVIGGHGSRPEATVDPITMACYAVTRLQTVASRVVPSQEAGVLTVGQISGGTAENIIPGSAFIKVNTRADSNELAEKMERTIKQIMIHEVQAAMVDVDPNSDLVMKNPTCKSLSHLPLLKNEDDISNHIAGVFSNVFGEENFTYPVPGVSGSEDFAVLAKSPDGKAILYCYRRYGSTDQNRWDDVKGKLDDVASNHNSNFYPQMLGIETDPLRTGTKAALCCGSEQVCFDLGSKNEEMI